MVRRAAQHLEEMGCRAIAAECGYFAYFQREIAASVRVPVFMSSLLQVPFAQQLIGPDRVVGILMAEECYLSEHHLRSVGIAEGSNYVVGGALDAGRCVEFNHLWTGGKRSDPPAAEYAKAEAEFLGAAVDSSASTPTWARWCWSAPASRPSPAPCSERSTCPCSVGARCLTMPTRWPSTGITSGTCNMRPSDTHRTSRDACPSPLLPSRSHLAADSRSFWQKESSP